MLVYENKDVHQIRSHKSMLKPDGTMHRLSTIKFWINRFLTEGNMKSKPKPGRSKKLDAEQEEKLINLIESHPKKRYNEVVRLATEIELPAVSGRTANRIANRRGYRK